MCVLKWLSWGDDVKQQEGLQTFKDATLTASSAVSPPRRTKPVATLDPATGAVRLSRVGHHPPGASSASHIGPSRPLGSKTYDLIWLHHYDRHIAIPVSPFRADSVTAHLTCKQFHAFQDYSKHRQTRIRLGVDFTEQSSRSSGPLRRADNAPA